MSRFAAIRDEARRDLHREAEVPALYIAGDASPREVTVRVHRRGDNIGRGAVPGLAEMVDLSPKIVFLRSEVPMPARGAIVSIADGEAWVIGESELPDGITVTAVAAQLSVAKAAGLPVPF